MRNTLQDAQFIISIFFQQGDFFLFDGPGALIFFDSPAGKNLGVNDNSFHPGRNPQRGIFHIAGLFTEYGPQQFFFRRQLGFPLGGDFADQDIPRADFGTQPDNAAVVKILQRFFAHIGDIPGNLFLAELGIPGHDFKFLNVHRSIDAVSDQTFADQNRVFEIIAAPGHEGHGDIFSQRQFALVGGRSVGNDLAGFDLLALCARSAAG